jgi:hypothetical protein
MFRLEVLTLKWEYRLSFPRLILQLLQSTFRVVQLLCSLLPIIIRA